MIERNKFSVLIAVINPDTAPIEIIPSTPKFKTPDFSAINSPNAAIKRRVAACRVAFTSPKN